MVKQIVKTQRSSYKKNVSKFWENLGELWHFGNLDVFFI